MNSSETTILKLIPTDAERRIADVTTFLNSEKIVSVTCGTDTEYLAAGELIKELKKIDKELDGIHREIKDPLVKQSKAIDGRFRPVFDLVTDRIKAINAAIWKYDRDKEAERQKAQAEADRLAREQQKKLQEKAAAEAAKAEEYRKQGREDLAAKRDEKAATLQATAEVIQPVAVQVAPPKIQGLITVETWKGRITDKAAAMKWAVAAGMFNLFDVNDGALNAQAKACKGEMQIPGVEWIKEVSTRTR
jgi:hypothetical protein